MKRIVAIALVLVIAAVTVAGLLSLAGRETAQILAAYDQTMGLRRPPHLAAIDDDPCTRYEAMPGGNDVYMAVRRVWSRDCVGPYRAEVMHGVWYDGFEERSFVPDVDSVPLYRVIDEHSLNTEFDTELHIDVDEAMQRLGITDRPTGTVAIAITFVGRRTTPFRTPSGHLYHTVIVDAVLSGRLLGRVITRIDMPGCTGECAEPR